MTENNMRIWDQVCKTDPAKTKSVKYPFRHTAIDPQYQLQAATKLWGPYGATWGMRDFLWGTIGESDGAPPRPSKSDDGGTVFLSMTLDVTFWYPDGSFPVSHDMPFTHRDHCRLKLITHCRSKALSLLGFSADVYLGKFEDAEYVKDLKVAFVDDERLRSEFTRAILKASPSGLSGIQDRLDSLAEGANIGADTYRDLSLLVEQTAGVAK